jgi:hypothetical protein
MSADSLKPPVGPWLSLSAFQLFTNHQGHGEGQVVTRSWKWSEGVFSCFKLLKILQDFPSYRIFRRMNKALNIDKK